jgi:hypothetical protein
VLPTRRRLGLGLLAVAMASASGCTGLGDPASAQSLTRNDLVSELAAQLAGSGSLTYAATYQLAGGATASVTQAQRPLRAAYRYPGGEVLVTSAAITHCAKKVCTMTAPVTPPPSGTFTDAHKAGLATPAAVEELLNTARMDPDLNVVQRDTTVAGRHATCVTLGNVDSDLVAGSSSTGASPAPQPSMTSGFSTCITSDGVIGSFTGTLHGTPIDVALTDYSDHVPSVPFEPPPAAKLVDHRSK